MENAKTIRDLLNAAPLSEGDYLPVNQPNVFNPVTQQNGDTRRATIKQLMDYFDESYQPRIVGKYEYPSFEPTPLQYAKWRLLPLKYQIIETALYQELCALKWVGASANATADWWYRCNADGARNADGLYMRVEDARGISHRGAGANAVKKGASNAPLRWRGYREIYRGCDQEFYQQFMAYTKINKLGNHLCWTQDRPF